ncbi:MAG: isoprenylcysteine carboxylmethyltransferase family protein [Pseudomonadota bacterium]
MTWTVVILVFVTLQRLGELWLAQRNTARLLERGAIEHAPKHYLAIVALHTAWLAGLWYVVLTSTVTIAAAWLVVFVILQGLRVWVLMTLGERWTTRIIVVPGEARIRTGPFRFLNHPNYTVVIGEIAALPLVFSLVWYAIAFSIANALLLTLRIWHENRALEEAEATAVTLAS